jgi:hypothetical protein
MGDRRRRILRGRTLIFGYSTAGNSPSKVDLKRTIPEYSA